ncbi:P-loop containing nucleoside triphosphate hydrolase protein [Thelonectria olida]|uniref:P-loop containing nucleoside triphosphate hydrolase protein n=1 Tax=Thelonectria olida TaxID=1576542 RepID=A0A9P8VX84_9HYPO|nr:P-loop containing nucleoside triphosphate hydrolase protein [Thelonectria olida]
MATLNTDAWAVRAPTFKAHTLDGSAVPESACTSLSSPLHQTTPPTSPVDSDSFTSEGENQEITLAQRLVSAVENLITAKLADDSSSGGKDTDAECKKPQPSRASTLAYKRVEEAWDDKTYKYKIVEATKSGVGDLDQYVFVVRDRIDRRTQDTTSFVDIKSTSLRDIVRGACCNIRGVSLAKDTPSVEQNVLFHVRHVLKSRHSKAIEDEDGEIHNHLGLLVDYLEITFRSTEEHLSALLAKHEITYDLLWALFEPNTEVYTTCRGTDAPRCVLYNHCEEREEMDGSKFMHLETRFLSSDGKCLGEATSNSKIPFFRGGKKIEFLPAYPLQYHPSRERVAQELIGCGRRFASLIGIHHQQYEGKAFSYDDKGEIVKRHVKGRIMIDAICFEEQNPDHPFPRVRKTEPRDPITDPIGSLGLTNLDPSQLEESDFIICGPTVFGFCLSSKAFLEFAVANITEIPWSPSSFKDVKIPESQKKPIWALTKAYLDRDESDGFRDLVQGKGRGINFLLYGPPGVGKTLTAETIAETYRIPLYTVPAGQIGVDPVKVERILTSIFKIASRWKAILLLDEADVFLAQRSNDPHLNALVSVFLRELEQYDGILFLTTNRVQSFDEAVISRIHLALQYNPLGRDAREAVWKFFLGQANTRHGSPDCPQDAVDKLAEKELNGREIRNAVFVARSMAQYEGTVVCATHLKESISAREQFQRDFQGAGAVDNLNSYF